MVIQLLIGLLVSLFAFQHVGLLSIMPASWWKRLVVIVAIDTFRWDSSAIRYDSRNRADPSYRSNGNSDFVIAMSLVIPALLELLLHIGLSSYILSTMTGIALGIWLFHLPGIDVETVKDHWKGPVSRKSAFVLVSAIIAIILLTRTFRIPPPQSPLSLDAHPIEQFISTSRAHFSHVLGRQSRTLSEAVAEDECRYGMHPPPKFDRWFAFVRSRYVRMIDEYDKIHHLLTPFWGVRPVTVRAASHDALGAEDTHFMDLLIRDGEVMHRTQVHWEVMRS